MIITILVIASIAKAWKHGTIDYELLEKDWEHGDDDEELKTEQDVRFKEMYERMAKAGTIGDNKDTHGPQLMHITLKNDRDEWTPEDVSELTTRWAEMLSYATSVKADYYRSGKHRVVAAVERGWQCDEVKAFVLQQPEVVDIEWRKKKYPATHEEL